MCILEMLVMTDGISNLVFQEWNSISPQRIDDTKDLFQYRIWTPKKIIFLDLAIQKAFVGSSYH